MNANEPTATGPNAPKQDRMAKARAAKAAQSDRISQLEEQIAALAASLKNQQDSRPEPATIQEEYAPGEYYIGGTDAATGKPVLRKRRWTKSDIERLYPKVTFAPTITAPIRPHGITYEVEAGKIVEVPSIVKDIHDQMVWSIRRQSEGYRVSDEQTRQVFDAAKSDPNKGRYFEPLKHVGYGWPIEALQAAAKGLGDDAKTMEEIGWEPEVGFPGGFGGKALPTK